MGETEAAKVGITVDEFGRQCWVLMQAMKDEPAMNLLEVLRSSAEVQ